MKKCIGIKPLLLMLLFFLGINKIYAQTNSKTIVCDWDNKETPFNASFPFDEPFQIQIKNLPNSFKEKLSLYILEFDSKKELKLYHDTLNIDSPKLLDTNYFSKLKGQILTYILNDDEINGNKYKTLTSVEFSFLKPNKYYTLLFCSKKTSPLTKLQHADLKQSFIDTKFKDIIKSNILKTNYKVINTNFLLDLFNKEVLLTKKISNKYEFIKTQIDDDKIHINLLNAIQVLAQKGNKIKQVIKNLTQKIDNTKSDKSAENGIDSLKESLGKLNTLLITVEKSSNSDPGVYYPDLNDLDDFKSKLASVKTEIEEEAKSLNSKFNDNHGGNISSELSKIDDSYIKDLDKIDNDINNAIDALITTFESVAFYSYTFLQTSTLDQSTKEASYTSQTFGYGYNFGTGTSVSYFALSFFFRPVNNNVSLSNTPWCDRWKVMLCLNLGFTLEDISTNKNAKVSGLPIIGNKAGLIGLGFRPLPYLKFDFNTLLYYSDDSNPLNDHKKFTCSPFVGFSVNLNIVKILTGQPNSLTTLKTKANSLP